MKYSELIEYMHMFRLGKIDHDAMAVIIHLWQRSKGFEVKENPIDIIRKTLRMELCKIGQVPYDLIYGRLL